MTAFNLPKSLRRPIILAAATAFLAGSAVAADGDAQTQARQLLAVSGKPAQIAATRAPASRLHDLSVDAQAQARRFIAVSPEVVNTQTSRMSGPMARGTRAADAQQRARRLIAGTAG